MKKIRNKRLRVFDFKYYSRGMAYADGHGFYLKESYRKLPWWKKIFIWNYVEPKEKLRIKIRDFVKKNCPDFLTDDKLGGSVWHHCHCRVECPNIDADEAYSEGYCPPCECVWSLKSSCSYGFNSKDLQKIIENNKE